MNKKVFFIPLVLLIVAVLDLLNRAFCTYAFNHVPEGSRVYGQHIYQLNTHQSDIVILGASCANHSFIPQMFEDSLGMTCYNYGQDGRNINYQYLCLLRALKNGPVKYVILDLTSPQVADSWKKRYEYHQTYYWQNEDASTYMDEIVGLMNRAKMVSSFLQYNNKLFVALSTFVPMSPLSDKGYVPLPYTGRPFTDVYSGKDSDFQVADYADKYFGKLIELCQQKNIKLIVCISPKLEPETLFGSGMQDYCNKYHVEWWNDCTLIQNRMLFKDFVHLNDSGAHEYTRIIIKRMNSTN